MQNALPLFLILAGFILVVGTVVMIVALRRAPEGYEGENGFQFITDEEGFQYRPASAEPLASRLHEHAHAA
ncbi:MAG: hypothetical protein ABIZ49_06845 [Opitutaceae bacterium]